MAVSQPHLELRATSYYWRRRVPARESNRFKPAFFCFSLQTHVIREAADLARRITAISNICFNAETDMPPEMMTQIMINYARIEIETSDQLRQVTGPRTREAAEAALAVEAAARASLRDAIFLCDRTPALSPIHDTAARLGISIDEQEEDFGVLAGKMVRLMIELSEEKERRARGYFAEPQPYLSAALQQSALPTTIPVPPRAAAPNVPVQIETIVHAEPPADIPTNLLAEQVSPAPQASAEPTSETFHARDGLSIKVDTSHGVPARMLDGTDPRILDLWDAWFDEMSRGVYRTGAYTHENGGKAARFLKEADTIKSTRKLIKDILGDIRIAEADGAVWARFNDIILKLPSNHGKSSKLRHLSCLEFIELEEKKERKRIKSAEQSILREGIIGDEKEKLLREARISRISPRTFQRHQKHLSGPLDHAVALGRLSHNPFKPFVLGEAIVEDMRKSLPETKRQLWTTMEFDALLGTEKWQSSKTQINDPIYWVPLIARLHGLRSEEILQPKPKNVRCDEGIHFFDIECGTGQSLKSNNARRMVPIHSQLIELGFLDFVERQLALRKERLFDKVTRSNSKKLTFTANFTKNFTYYRKTREVYDERRDLHAMRTTCNTTMVGSSVPDTARRYLMGHKNEDIGIINYLPEGFPLKTLKKYIELQQIDLTIITKRFGKPEEQRRGPYLAVERGIEVRATKSA